MEEIMPEFRTSNPLNILVLAGGISSEREVSLAGGQSVSEALKQAGHNVKLADISPENLSALDDIEIDVVFPVLHGLFGEDGQLQAILETRKIKFVGSGSSASKLAMDKWNSKQLFEENGIDTTIGKLLTEDEFSANDSNEICKSIITELGLPLVLKPVDAGSSVGVFLAKNANEIETILGSFFSKYGDCLIEKYNSGAEYTVGIVCGQILPIIQIKAAVDFYDYDAKYQRNDTEYIFDVDLDSNYIEIMNTAALRAYQLLGCKDIARVDFMFEQGAVPQLLEVNTLPGFTDHSLVPKAGKKIGLSMPELCDKIAQNAYNRPI